MRETIWVLTVGLMLGTHPAAAQSKFFNQTVQLAAGGSVALHADKGSVRMMAWDRDQVEIRARIEADSNPSSDAARRAVDATKVDVTTFGNRVVIRSNYDDTASATSWIFGQRTPDIHYEIRAPKRIDLRLEIDRSDTVLTGFEGRMILEFDRSEIEGTDLTGDILLSIDRGGDSSFRNVRGAVRIESDRTNLRIDFVRLDGASRIEIDRGDAELSVVREQGFTLDTSLSRRANFDTNLPVDQSSSRDRRNPSGSFNGGGPRLSIEADRSHIRLRS